MTNNNTRAFLSLLQAGLWEKDIQIVPYGKIDYSEVKRMADEQSVLGLIAAGFDHVSDTKVLKKDVIQIVGQTIRLEQRNLEMNRYIGTLVEKMRADSIYALLIKGQAVAQCYERPLWRSSGDVDFYLNKEDFEKAKFFFRPFVESFEPDNNHTEHINMHYDSFVVEIHANQHTSISSRIDRVMDEIHHDLFYRMNVKTWMTGDTTVFIPSPNNHVIIVFTHFLKHFYKGGLGLRQICDWCRLLWKYRTSVDIELLKNLLDRMGTINIWKAFASFAVDYLGMPLEAMPFYSSDPRYKKKAQRIFDFVFEVGNFGHNRDNSYYTKYPRLIRKTISLSYRVRDIFRHSHIFPIESMRFFPMIVFDGVRLALRGE